MKSKKIRKVILKTPSLRRARNNLRIILKLTVKEELRRLDKLYSLYRFKKMLTPSQQKRRSQLGKEWKSLDGAYYKSTLRCGCGGGCTAPQDRLTDLDLVWIPWFRRWVCIECFEVCRFDEMTHEDFDDPVSREWVKNEFGI